MYKMFLRSRAAAFVLLSSALCLVAAPGCSGVGGELGAGSGGEQGSGGSLVSGTGGVSVGAGGSGSGSGGVLANGAGGSGLGSGGRVDVPGVGGGEQAATGGASTSTGGNTSTSGPVFHVFMLMGQSNMAGVAAREASDTNTDERLKVLGGCNLPANQWNTVGQPPLSDCPGEKGWNTNNAVDPGIWFGKTLLEKLPPGDTIGLVATAESGESINTFVSGGSHHNMILNKIAKAKTAENVHFAGIIFHQGESDSGQSSWPGKVVQLYNEVKEAWGVDYDVPFILGELPAGGCCSGHNSLVHQAADQLPMGDWVSQEGTKVLDQYHFDHPSVVLMGTRYGEAMIEALGW